MSAKSQHKSILFALLGFVTVIVIVAVIGYFTIDRTPEIIQGEVEISEYRVACKLPGRVTELHVKEGDFVHKGDILATIAMPEANAQEKVAEAAAGATEAISDLTSAPTRKQTVEAAYQLYQQALAAKGIAEKTYTRLERLFEEGVMSEQKRDEAKAAFDAATAAVGVAESQWELAKEGARREAKQAAKKQAEAARSAVDVVRSLLKETVQRATADGEVEEIYPKVGELLGLGSPIMTISMVEDVWGTFNVREDQLKGMKVGNTITAFVPALNKNIKMKVTSLKDQGAYAVWKATKSNGEYDLKTFEVKAKPVNKVEGLKPGMSLILKQ